VKKPIQIFNTRMPASCRRLQSSALVLANSADSCSDSLTMGQTSCSHYLPLCSPSSGRARQRRIVLTLAANDRTEVRVTPVLAGKSHIWGSLALAVR